MLEHYGGVWFSTDTSPTIRWRLGDLIGWGAHARVYKGQIIDSGEIIAVKEVLIGASSGSREQAQVHIREVEKEVNLLHNLSHRNIVKYLGTTRNEQALYILLEYIPCGSLSYHLGEFGPLREPGANILVDKDGSIKLADFGASKQLLELEKVTGAKSLKGTIHWMAPEVIRRTGHRLSADIWSVGCTVVEMATGKPPWGQQDEEVEATLYHIASTKSHPPIPDHLSSEAKDFLQQCFEIDPNLRPTASELLQHPFVVGNHIYDVFLSFRGPDVRNTLAKELFEFLQSEGLHVFLDSERIEKGDNIGMSLEEAIKDSRLFIPIFSPEYASSAWCLRELSLIWRCKARGAKIKIIPVFYDVQPWQVRYPESERSPYAEAFKRHRSARHHSREEIDEWKKALYEVSSLSGWQLPGHTIPVIVKGITALFSIKSRQLSGTQVTSPIATVTSTWTSSAIIRMPSLLSPLIRFTSAFTNSLKLRHPFFVGDHRERHEHPRVRPSALGECDSNFEKDDESEYYSVSSSDSDIYSAVATCQGQEPNLHFSPSAGDTIVAIVETANDSHRVEVPPLCGSDESIHQNGDEGFEITEIRETQVATCQVQEPIHRNAFVVDDHGEAHPLVGPSALGECDSNYEKDEFKHNSESSSDGNRSTSDRRLASCHLPPSAIVITTKKMQVKFLMNEKTKRKAFKSVAGIEGVDSVIMDMNENKITIVGSADPVCVMVKLRKLGSTQLLSVGHAKESKKDRKPVFPIAAF